MRQSKSAELNLAIVKHGDTKSAGFEHVADEEKASTSHEAIRLELKDAVTTAQLQKGR